MAAQVVTRWAPAAVADFFVFLPFSRKILTYTPLTEIFKKMDPELGAMVAGAELTCLGVREVFSLKIISVSLL